MSHDITGLYLIWLHSAMCVHIAPDCLIFLKTSVRAFFLQLVGSLYINTDHKGFPGGIQTVSLFWYNTMGRYFTLCAHSRDTLTKRSSWLDGLFHRTWAETLVHRSECFERETMAGRQKEKQRTEEKE